ncbi:hypothetical protein, partial [Flavobacterium sp.]|uniref:hypothetical protein n=1 Tax=Flavobacterium sp. TaxID=239 RepID=UPI0022C1F36D
IRNKAMNSAVKFELIQGVTKSKGNNGVTVFVLLVVVVSLGGVAARGGAAARGRGGPGGRGGSGVVGNFPEFRFDKRYV